jgi:transcriptional regulator with XRE-family HTH domain
MTERNNRIREAIESKSSQQKVADRLKITRQAVNLQLSKKTDIDSVEFIDAVAELTGYSRDFLIKGTDSSWAVAKTEEEVLAELARIQHLRRAGLPEISKNSNDELGSVGGSMQEDAEVYLTGKNIRPITVSVDRSGNELITYVPVKAQAGYRKGYGDPQFLQQLPAFSLPIIISKTRTYRMFQTDGNSMRQLGGGGLNDGDVVIAGYVEDVFSVKDGRVYVVVTTEGVLIKRIINRLSTPDKVLICNSDNKSGEYGAIIVHPHEILEVWEYVAHISKRLEFSVDLWEVLNELQAKQAILEDQIKQMKGDNSLKLKG